MLQLEHIPDDWMADWLLETRVMRMNGDRSNSLHRVQRIQARHGNNVYYEETDLGEATNWMGEDLQVWALGQTQVGRVRDIAERERIRKTFAERYGVGGPEDMLSLLYQVTEEKWKRAQHISSFGNAIARQR